MMTSRLQISLAMGVGLALVGHSAMAQSVRAIPLPAELHYPEGIGYDPDGYVFTASASDGAVVRTSLKDGSSTTITKPGVLLRGSSANFPRILGIKVDGSKRLWIAGGRTGKIFALDSRSGRLIKELVVAGEGSVLNDAVATREAVYVTDTLRPILWRIALSGNGIGEPEPWINFGGTPIEYADGLNLNGIAIDPTGRSLIVVQMDKGLLFKIDVNTKAIAPIDIGGADLSGGDGLVLDGTTLYVVRQPAAEIVSLQLAPDLSSARVVSRYRSPVLQWPATAAKVGNDLLVVNSQFNKQGSGNPTVPFTVSVIPVAALGPK